MGGGHKTRGFLKIHTSLKLKSCLSIKAHLVTIRAVSIPAIIFRPIRIFKDRKKGTLGFQLLMSWLYNYPQTVFFQECICKNKIKTNLKIKYMKAVMGLQLLRISDFTANISNKKTQLQRTTFSWLKNKNFCCAFLNAF